MLGRDGGSRPLGSFNLPPAILSKLLGCGFTCADDVLDVSPSDLAQESNISPSEAVHVIDQIKESLQGGKKAVSKGQTAFELLQTDINTPTVHTFVEEIDKMLGGGIRMGQVTEFIGVPGIGKTQLGIQLAVDVQFPVALGGPGGQCIYIDSEGSFVPERVAEIAASFVDQVQFILEKNREQMSKEDIATSEKVTIENVLSRIHYYRVHNYVEQIAVVNVLRNLLKSELSGVKLIVVDSIAFHFRRDFKDYAMRSRLLSNMSSLLLNIAKEFELAVVLMNQVTTRIRPGKPAELVPALGETWGHSATNRVMLFQERGQRYARIFKSPSQKMSTVSYQITEGGLRSVDQ